MTRLPIIIRFGLLALLVAAMPAGATCWQVTPAQSRFSFTANQAGGTLDGRFDNYTGRLCTETETPTVQVRVQLASVHTDLPELDEALRGEDFFAVSRWPTGQFTGTALRALGGNRYSVTGSLRLRDVTREITVPFTLEPDKQGQRARLQSEFTIQRLDYGIGQGQWADTQWVGDPVHLKIDASLRRMDGSAMATLRLGRKESDTISALIGVSLFE